MVAAPLPDEVLRSGLVGPRLSALIAYQKGACHMTYRVIETFLADVLQLRLCTGQLAKVVRKVRDVPDEVDTLKLEQIEVKSYVGGLVKGFERRAA